MICLYRDPGRVFPNLIQQARDGFLIHPVINIQCSGGRHHIPFVTIDRTFVFKTPDVCAVLKSWNTENLLIRFDNLLFQDSGAVTNEELYAVDFGGRHADTGLWPNSNWQISPRVGFTWDVFGDKALKVRGGTGLFAGRLPLVFFTNMPSQSGMIQTTYVSNDPTIMAQFAGDLKTNVRDMEVIMKDYAQGMRYYAAVDPDFKMPQVWKSSIALDYQVPVSFPLTVTGELTYTKNINAVHLTDWNMKDPDDTWGHMTGADNRLIYPAAKDYQYTSKGTYVLTNNHKGYGWTANITINAEPIPNLYLMAAYTHTVNKEVTGLPGSNAQSAWQYQHTVNGPNTIEARNSGYVTPDRVIANVSYKYGKDHFSLFYSGYSPSGWSYCYGNDINGDGLAYDLMYIPRDDSEIKFVSDNDRIAFWNYVEQDDYLKNHKGEYADSYAAHAPWVHTFDFKWAHDFDIKIGRTTHKLQLIANVENIGNLLNSKWGVAQIAPNMSNNKINLLSVANAADVKNGAQPIFRMNTNTDGSYLSKTWDYNHSYGQCWRLQLGVKYYFN